MKLSTAASNALYSAFYRSRESRWDAMGEGLKEAAGVGAMLGGFTVVIGWLPILLLWSQYRWAGVLAYVLVGWILVSSYELGRQGRSLRILGTFVRDLQRKQYKKEQRQIGKA